MRRVTVDRIMALGPCTSYTRERVEALWGGRRSLTPSEIVALDIAHADRVWALVRVITRRARVAWACDCAERTMPLWLAQRPEDRRPQDAIRTTRMWLRGDASHAEVRDAAIAAAAARATDDAAAYATAADAYAAASSAYAATAYATAIAAAAAYATDADDAAATDDAACAAANARWRKELAWQLARLVEYAEERVKP